MTKKGEKRVGRPTLEATDRKTRNFTFRSRNRLHERLEQAARLAGRSISEEIEARLERSFLDQERMVEALNLTYDQRLTGILFAIAEAMNASGQDAGLRAARTVEGSRDWFDNPYAYDQAARAASAIIKAMKPEGDPLPPPQSVPLNTIGDLIPNDANANAEVGKRQAAAIIEEVASGYARNSRKVERARFLHRVNPLADRLRKYCDAEWLNADSHLGDDQ